MPEAKNNIAYWLCDCHKTFICGFDAFQHRRECSKNCRPITELELPLKRITGIERMELEAEYGRN